MDLERSPPPEGASPAEAAGGAACSICLDPVVGRGGGRSVAKLQCGHEFHLDCIGSAFNAKGAMQCPNCRKIEKGRWLYASGHRPSPDIDIGGWAWVTGETYDITSDLPFGFQWCPFSGFTQLASVFDPRQAYRGKEVGGGGGGVTVVSEETTMLAQSLRRMRLITPDQ